MPRVLLTEEEKRERIAASKKKWVENNREAYNAMQRPHTRKFYEENKIEQRELAMKRYYYKKEAEVFRNILL